MNLKLCIVATDECMSHRNIAMLSYSMRKKIPKKEQPIKYYLVSSDAISAEKIHLATA